MSSAVLESPSDRSREEPPFPLATDLAEGRTDRLLRLFDDEGMPPPRLVWSPRPSDMPIEAFGRLLAYWRELGSGGALPSPRAIDPTEMGYLLGNLMLVDVVDGGVDFAYRLYGTRIAASYGQDMTGRRVSDFHGRLRDFFFATYGAVVLRPEPLYTEHVPVPREGVTLWRRMILPLGDAEGAVVRFLVANVPESAGIPPALHTGETRTEPGG